MKRAILALVALIAGVPAAKAATILYTTDFNSSAAGHTGNFSGSADYADGPIIGQDNWALTSSTTNPINVANTATNGNVTLTTTGQDVNRQFATANPITSGSVYLSADIDVTAAQATGDYFIHLDDGTTSDFFDRVFVKSSGTGFVMALSTSTQNASLTYGATVLNFNTVYHIVAQYNIISGTGNDTASLYLNPTDPIIGGDNLYVTGETAGTDATSIKGVNLRQGTATSAPNVIVDNIAVAAPEPASISMVGLLSLGLLRRRQTA